LIMFCEFLALFTEPGWWAIVISLIALILSFISIIRTIARMKIEINYSALIQYKKSQEKPQKLICIILNVTLVNPSKSPISLTETWIEEEKFGFGKFDILRPSPDSDNIGLHTVTDEYGSQPIWLREHRLLDVDTRLGQYDSKTGLIPYFKFVDERRIYNGGEVCVFFKTPKKSYRKMLNIPSISVAEFLQKEYNQPPPVTE